MQVRPIKIVSSGKYLPKKQVTAAELGKKIGVDSSWIEKKSGVLIRHFVDGETSSLMGAFAAKDALHEAGLSIHDIDCIVGANSTPEQTIPCTAALIQKQLGAANSGIPAFDINSTCLSFLTALDTISYLVNAGKYQRALIISSEIASYGINWEDKESATLFGDGAAAVVITKSNPGEGAKILTSGMETYSQGAHLSEAKGGGTSRHPREYSEAIKEEFLFKMDGRAIFRLASQTLPKFLDKLLKSADLTLEDIQLVIPHQASLMAMRLMRKQLGIPEAKWMEIAQNHGNTIAASIPMGLHEAIVQGRVQRGDRVLLIGTAAGFSIGGMILEY